MRLTDIMSRLDLSVYPQIALVMFLIIFAAAMKHVFSRARTEEFRRGSTLPLESDDQLPAPPTNHYSGSST